MNLTQIAFGLAGILSLGMLLGCEPRSSAEVSGSANDQDLRDKLTEIEAQVDSYDSQLLEGINSLSRLEGRVHEQVEAVKVDVASTDKHLSALGEGVTDALNALNDRIEELKARTAKLDLEMSLLENRIPQDKVAAELDPAVKGHSICKDGHWSFLATVEDANPFLDGYKVKIGIGNPCLVSFSGFTLKVRYGPRKPTRPKPEQADEKSMALWSARYESWLSDLKSKEVKFTESLSPGAWTVVEVVLPDAEPEEIGHLSVEIEIDQLFLRRTSAS